MRADAQESIGPLTAGCCYADKLQCILMDYSTISA